MTTGWASCASRVSSHPRFGASARVHLPWENDAGDAAASSPIPPSLFESVHRLQQLVEKRSIGRWPCDARPVVEPHCQNLVDATIVATSKGHLDDSRVVAPE